uniref:Uncharacterized protein n=1 Tax=Rhizophora mucronata TaxID=61149 RepID=A0A2P2MFR5_RHIMU
MTLMTPPPLDVITLKPLS